MGFREVIVRKSSLKIFIFCIHKLPLLFDYFFFLYAFIAYIGCV